jgi:glucosamine-phosphate N-acetyltransferase
MVTNVRKVELSDYYKGYPEMMKEYYEVNKNISFNEFCKWMLTLNSNNQVYILEFQNKVIGRYTLKIEDKLYHKVGYLEDLFISKKFRNKGLGIYLVGLANYKAEKEGCKKIVLNCKSSLYSFFQINMYKQEGINMHKIFF